MKCLILSTGLVFLSLFSNAQTIAIDTTAVHKTGNEIISGNKTFTTKIGVGNQSPRVPLDVNADISNGKLGTVLGRLSEGDQNGDGTYLGTRGFTTQGSSNIKSFSLEHSFYGHVNSAINFYRGANVTGGYMSFNTNSNNEQMRITETGKIGIGTTQPKSVLDVGTDLTGGKLGTIFGRLPEGNSSGDGTYLGVRGYSTNGTNNVKSFSLEHSFYGQINSAINFYRGTSMTGGYITFNTNDNSEKMRLTENGNVGIGINNPNEKLEVNGIIRAKELRIEATNWPDYVFAKTHQLPTLNEVERYIKQNAHLPEVPSAKEVEEKGLTVGEMNKVLLKKIEELTLYVIDLKKELELVKQTSQQ